MSDFWCDVCGKNDDAPHTPIDHPWLIKGHRLIPKPKVDEMIAAAVAAERAKTAALDVEALARAINPVPFAPCNDPEDEPFCEHARAEARKEAERLAAAYANHQGGQR